VKQLTAITLSGGVDSLVAAYLLKQQGHNLIGIHFITGYETDHGTSSEFTLLPDMKPITAMKKAFFQRRIYRHPHLQKRMRFI